MLLLQIDTDLLEAELHNKRIQLAVERQRSKLLSQQLEDADKSLRSFTASLNMTHGSGASIVAVYCCTSYLRVYIPGVRSIQHQVITCTIDDCLYATLHQCGCRRRPRRAHKQVVGLDGRKSRRSGASG